MILAFLKKEIKKILPAYKHARISYSQEGEDMIINRFFEHKKKGFSCFTIFATGERFLLRSLCLQ